VSNYCSHERSSRGPEFRLGWWGARGSADRLVCCFADCQSANSPTMADVHFVTHTRLRGDGRGLATRDTAGWAACATCESRRFAPCRQGFSSALGSLGVKGNSHSIPAGQSTDSRVVTICPGISRCVATTVENLRTFVIRHSSFVIEPSQTQSNLVRSKGLCRLDSGAGVSPASAGVPPAWVFAGETPAETAETAAPLWWRCKLRPGRRVGRRFLSFQS
jgi:hypothetical protein